jgi:hypothetical protein
MAWKGLIPMTQAVLTQAQSKGYAILNESMSREITSIMLVILFAFRYCQSKAHMKMTS